MNNKELEDWEEDDNNLFSRHNLKVLMISICSGGGILLLLILLWKYYLGL